MEVEMNAMADKEKNMDQHMKDKLEQEKEVDELQDANWYRIFMTLVWIGSGCVMIWYLTEIVAQYKTAKANPASTILVVEQDRLPMPTIAICNWNQDGSVEDPTPTGCPLCNITLVDCLYNTSTSCMDKWIRHDYQTPGGLFSCWQYNDDTNNVEFSNTTGYSGSLATIWAIPYIPRNNFTNRMGVQVTFKPVAGVISGMDIYNEINFAAVGFDTFFSLTYVNTIHNELPTTDPLYNTSTYDASASTVTLLNSLDQASAANDTVPLGYLAITFAFQTLSLQQVTFDISYNINNLFGDFAGMIGTLMGLDMIKLMAGLPMGYLAYKSRSWRPMQDAFNG